MIEEGGDLVFWVAVEAEDRGQLHAGGAGEFEAVFDGILVGFLVGYDMAFGEGREAYEGEEAMATECASAVGAGLHVGVEGGAMILEEDAGSEPGLEGNIGLFIG